MKMLKVRFKSDIDGVIEERANRNVEAGTTLERSQGLYAARKLFIKFKYDSY